ncbi:MAG: superoxide dismutase [Alphaproteobacteria bacterium]|nr:MAG: superoxide dismutase [Alphaproteobacteria bacterium]
MSFSLPDLPYAYDALAPHISKETLTFHHTKHHQTYVTNLNNLIHDTPQASLSLEEVITQSHHKKEGGIFNNAAQVWNHTFYWKSMTPRGGGSPTGAIAARIDAELGGYSAFQEAFTKAASTQFGSGWVWLIEDQGRLAITKTGNADLPLVHGQKALLTCDVWEHAYYLDFQNRRPDYVSVFLDYLVNWDFANKNLNQ